ncbi:hypothetical protein HQ447_06540 [bacterium]|nr:hypothetical protein [bacterium]
MKRYLLDVNALLAFMDPSHIHHEPFHEWLERKGEVTLMLSPMWKTESSR